MKQHSILGGILLIVGMSVGSGMLALPATMAEHGFLGAILLLVLGWVVVTFSAFLILEANLWVAPRSNMITMAKNTLGLGGQIVAWASYLLLLYSLTSAMIAGGADMLTGMLAAVGVPIPNSLSVLIFASILGVIVYKGIYLVDRINRGLMSVKFVVLIVAVILIIPFVNLEHLAHFYHSSIATAITVVITAYGFSIVIPSLRDYYHSDVVKLRKIVFYGSLIPLACYLIWVGVVLGVLPLTGDHSLINILHSSDPNTQLTQALSYYSNSSGLLACTRIFASICLATTFLGVSLSLVDFLADGFKLDKKGKQGYLLYSLTFVPPVLIVLCYPAAFIMALSYAGVFCTILMIILPAMMVWRGRYQQKLASTYRVMGGKPALIATFVIGLLVVILPFI